MEMIGENLEFSLLSKTPPPQRKASSAEEQKPENSEGWGWWNSISQTLKGSDVSDKLTNLSSSLNSMVKNQGQNLSSIVQSIVGEEDEPQHPEITEEEKEELGITPALLEFVENVSQHPSTFTNFPLDDDEDEVDLLLQQKKRRDSYQPEEASPAGDQSPEKLEKEQLKDQPPTVEASDAHHHSHSHSHSPHAHPHPHPHAHPHSPHDHPHPHPHAHPHPHPHPHPHAHPHPHPHAHHTLVPRERRRRVAREPFRFSPRQMKHVTAMLRLSKSLREVRHDVVPLCMEEDVFWNIYFELIKKRTSGMEWGKPVDEETDEHSQKMLAQTLRMKRELILSAYDLHGHEGSRTNWTPDHFTSPGFGSAEPTEESAIPKTEEWDGIILSGKEPPVSVSVQYTPLIRKGILPSHRKQFWEALTGSAVFIEKQPHFYTHSLRRVFVQKQEVNESENVSPEGTRRRRSTKEHIPAEIPAAVKRIPIFGGLFSPHDHFLSEAGIEASKRILVATALENPMVNYVPILPDLVLLALHSLPESTVYGMVHMMMSDAVPPYISQLVHEAKLKNKLDLKVQGYVLAYFYKSKKYYDIFLSSFMDLAPMYFPTLAAHFAKLGVEPHSLRSDFNGWFSRMFVSSLPHSTVLKIFDNYLNEGLFVLYKVALACLQTFEQKLLETNNPHNFLATLHEAMLKLSDRLKKHPEEEIKFLELVFSYELPFSQILGIEEKNRQDYEDKYPNGLEDPMFEVAYVPKIRERSNIITEEMFQVLWQWVPQRFKLCDAVQAFSTAVDGFSLISLYKKCGDASPHILLVKTKKNRIFGAYCTDGWKKGEKFYGMGECFLFTLWPKTQKYDWQVGNKDLFMLAEEQNIIIGGGGGAGLSLDGELWKGYSEFCETFMNDPLNDSPKDFECIAVEVYCFE